MRAKVQLWSLIRVKQPTTWYLSDHFKRFREAAALQEKRHKRLIRRKNDQLAELQQQLSAAQQQLEEARQVAEQQQVQLQQQLQDEREATAQLWQCEQEDAELQLQQQEVLMEQLRGRLERVKAAAEQAAAESPVE